MRLTVSNSVGEGLTADKRAICVGEKCPASENAP